MLMPIVDVPIAKKAVPADGIVPIVIAPDAELSDCGVFDATAGRQMIRVADAPRSGQYVMNDAGTYRFSPDDKGHRLCISYFPVSRRVTLVPRRG